jgi:hypothetical protein
MSKRSTKDRPPVAAKAAAGTPPARTSRFLTLPAILLVCGRYAVFPFLFAFAGAAFVRLEKDAIYLWDFATYWSQVIQLTNFLKQGGSLWVALKTIYQSTAATHYNLLPSLPLVPFQHLGLDPRTGYIVGICFLYLGLLYLVCCQLYAVQAEDKRKSSAWLVGGLVVLSSCTLWWPVYRGFVDVAALASALAGMFFAIKAESSDRPSIWYFIGGIFLGLAPVTRKAYSFYLLAFVIVFSVSALVSAIRTRRDIAGIWAEIRPKLFFFLGIAVVFAFFYGFFISTIKADRGVHSSYKTDESVWQQWQNLLSWFGVIPCMAYGLGLWVLVKSGRLKGALAAGVTASVLGAVLQMQTASLGEHHRYILVAGFISVLSAALGVAASLNWTQPSTRLFGLCTALSCAATVADLHGAGSKGDFFPSAGPSPYGERERARPEWWSVAFGGAGPKPISRTDLSEVKRLYAYLERICSSDPNPRVYILASGIVLGDGVIFSSLLNPPGLQLRCLDKFLPIHQVDSRDGVPSNILQATHVVTTDPVQLHLPPASHKCVVVPWEQFRDGRGIARAFERTSDEFVLENSIKVHVYRRTRPTTREDVAELESDLRSAGMIK